MTTIDYIFLAMSVLWLTFFVLAAVMNAIYFWQGYVLKQKAPSMVPLYGGLMGAAVLTIIPDQSFRHYAWLPLFLDIGCVTYLGYFLLASVLKKLRRTR